MGGEIVAHRYEVLTKQVDIDRYIKPIMQALGSDVPQEGCGVVYTEFDEQGEVVAFQILQSMLAAEGLWARDGSAHLRKLWKMLLTDVEKQAGKGSGRMLYTMTRTDEQGERIGHAVKLFGFEELSQKVYGRRF